MRTTIILSVCVLLVASPASALEYDWLACGHVHLAAENDKPSPPRQFVPSRLVDVLHFKLDVTPNFRARTVAGRATVTFKTIGKTPSRPEARPGRPQRTRGDGQSRDQGV
ncbi:MAG: hypothetical protein CME19_09310 [Gemmatimonadetes bacterium]|nr:hypothetical protein [Gemmatimonadota bacterium]